MYSIRVVQKCQIAWSILAEDKHSLIMITRLLEQQQSEFSPILRYAVYYTDSFSKLSPSDIDRNPDYFPKWAV